MKTGTKRLSWAKNLEMVALLEKVYSWYSVNPGGTLDQNVPTMMETKWASAFTFTKLAQRFKPEFGQGLSYADFAYSAFCQIDTRFRMRTGYGDRANSLVRVVERQAAAWWSEITEQYVARNFVPHRYNEWPAGEKRIFDEDRFRRNTAASASNAKRRIADDKRVCPITALNKSERVSLTCPLSNISQVAKSLSKKYQHDPLVSISFSV
jgi:hypothetical protein